jgi:hypothetical protein
MVLWNVEYIHHRSFTANIPFLGYSAEQVILEIPCHNLLQACPYLHCAYHVHGQQSLECAQGGCFVLQS